MKHIKSTVSLPVVLLLAVLTGVIATQALAGLVAPKQPVVATVNLQRVFEGLDQRDEMMQDIRQHLEHLRDQVEQREREVEEMQQRINQMEHGPDRDELRDELAWHMINFEFWQQQEMHKSDVDRSLMLEELFRTIKREVSSLAESQNYDMIFIDDSDASLQINPRAEQSREAQIDEQLGRRRMLFSSEELDITDELITRMNNRYQAGRTSG